MKLAIAAIAGIIAVFGVVMLSIPKETPRAEAGFSWFATKTPTRTPTPTATPPAGSTSPLAPPECAGMLFNTVHNDPTGDDDGLIYGTSGNDLIIMYEGLVFAGAGNDCIVFVSTEAAGQIYGEGGNDVIITRSANVHGIADGGAGTDRCIGNWEYRFNCEATN